MYFHSSRIKNLNQSLRLLTQTENPDWLDTCEFILICQDSFSDPIDIPIQNTKIFSMGMSSYNKPIMCNYGVNKCSNPCVALLDSDRIFVKNYFEKHYKSLQPNQAIVPTHLFSVLKDYEDDDLLDGYLELRSDFRSHENLSRRKNAFSGNTLFWKQDYLDCGGMDESFFGYGFADNDMTENFTQSNTISWVDCPEFHLFHPPEIFIQNAVIDDFRVFTLFNGIKYHKKWNKPIPTDLKILYHKIKNLPPTSQHLIDLWKEVCKYFSGVF